MVNIIGLLFLNYFWLLTWLSKSSYWCFQYETQNDEEYFCALNTNYQIDQVYLFYNFHRIK